MAAWSPSTTRPAVPTARAFASSSPRREFEYETVEIDLDHRPPWLYDKNPLGKVPVLEEADFLLPESRVIMEYLEERYPEPPLLPSDPGDRAAVRLCLERFEEFSRPYYRVLFEGRPVEELEAALARLDATLSASPYLVGSRFGLADMAYVPWIIRVEDGQALNWAATRASSAGWIASPSAPPSGPSWNSWLRLPSRRRRSPVSWRPLCTRSPRPNPRPALSSPTRP